MFLVVASGSSGYYRVDEDGYVYTARHYQVGLSREYLGVGIGAGRPLQEGERPRKGMTQFAGGTPYWLRTGQRPEVLTADQLNDLAAARAERDDLVAQTDELVGELEWAEQHLADTLERARR